MEHLRRNSFSCSSNFRTPKKRNLPKQAPLGHLPEDLAVLQHCRVIQRKLVYVINLPAALADEGLLRRYEYFGQYGSIDKLMLSKTSHPAQGKNTFAVYITFASEEQAVLCIKACHQFEIHGHTLSATYGTNKYCSFFLTGKSCPKAGCQFLHQLAAQRNMLTREGMPSKGHIQPENAMLDALEVVCEPPAHGMVLPLARIVRPRLASEQLPGLRFISLEETEEPPLDIAGSYKELWSLATPSKSSAEVPSWSLQDLMSPSSPDKWVTDVMEIRPRAFSEVTSSIEGEVLVVSLKPTGA